MVRDPDMDFFIYSTDVQERYEARIKTENYLFKQEASLSVVSRARIKEVLPIPDTLEAGNFRLTAIKKFTPYSQLVESKILEQFPKLNEDAYGSHFFEIQDKIAAEQGTYMNPDPVINNLND
jgi:hypothetical protein